MGSDDEITKAKLVKYLFDITVLPEIRTIELADKGDPDIVVGVLALKMMLKSLGVIQIERTLKMTNFRPCVRPLDAKMYGGFFENVFVKPLPLNSVRAL